MAMGQMPTQVKGQATLKQDLPHPHGMAPYQEAGALPLPEQRRIGQRILLYSL